MKTIRRSLVTVLPNCCRCSIFYASILGTNGDPRKLPLVLREKGTEDVEPTLIFDYTNWFLPALTQYVLQGGPMPDPRVFLLIGSEKKLSDIDENVPIYATVASRRAIQDLKKISALMVCSLDKHFVFGIVFSTGIESLKKRINSGVN